jgi:pimeloyl-ACP methyl ester carboxylesterase
MKAWLRGAAIIFLSFGTFSSVHALESPQLIGFFCSNASSTIVANQFYVPEGACIYLSPTISGSRYGDIYRGTVGSSALVNGHSLGFSATSSLQFGDTIPNGAQGEDIFVAVFPAQFLTEFRTYFQTGTGMPSTNNYGFLPFKWGIAPEPEPEEPDPVIVIPGILGSQERNGEWMIDPILHTYDDLIATLDANGFTPDIDLFTFPYNWRKSNVETAVLLKQKIDAVKMICACEKVDLVAHSMGGLVARQYIQSYAYEQDVDQLIFLGTPHLGAPKAYLMWEGGEFSPFGLRPDYIVDSIIELLLLFEAKERGYGDVFDYIRNAPILSVKELLPVYGYLFEDNVLREYPNEHPSNHFLDNLDNESVALYESGVEVHNFVGNIEGSSIKGLEVVASQSYSPKWENGYPRLFDAPLGNHGLILGDGDGTVPFESASHLSMNLNVNSFEHGEMVTGAQGEIFNILTGENASVLVTDQSGLVQNIMLFKMLSPADFMVVAPDGRRIGKDPTTNLEINEIPDAFYSGPYTDTEFVTIPNILEGEYKILTQGTGSGEYTLETNYINNATTTEAAYTANTSQGLVTELSLIVKGESPEKIEIMAADTSPPLITIALPNLREYLRSMQIQVEVIAEDVSGVSILETRLGTTTIPNIGTIDLFFEKLGTSTIMASSTDVFGNSTTSSRTFRIIVTASSTIADFERAYALGWMTKKVYEGLRQKIKGILVIRKVVKNVVQTIVETGSNGKKTNKKVQKKIETSEQVIDKAVARAILKEFEKYRGKGLDERAYQILKDDVTWLINN